MIAGKYFNRNVLALDDKHIGQVIRETPDKIVVIGDQNKRYDILLYGIKLVSKNVLVRLNIIQIEQKYRAKRNASLPNGKFLHPIKTNSKVTLASCEGKYDKSLLIKV